MRRVSRSKQRTNAVTRSDEHARSIAFLAAVIASRGARNGSVGAWVVDIEFIARREDLESSTEFRCAPDARVKTPHPRGAGCFSPGDDESPAGIVVGGRREWWAPVGMFNRLAFAVDRLR